MASEEKWYFTKEQLDSTPTRQCGISDYKELFYRQQAANFIQDMGQRLRVTQLCINTATVYMHRFYVFHSFTLFPWHSIAAAALFLSAKVEEQPRKLEHVIRIHNLCKTPGDNALDVQSERYQAQSQDLVFNENILLQTLGFDVAIDHPHAHVVRCCHLVRASKDLAQTSYFMASTSLHLTTMCLQYKPTVVACFCIHLACKWSNWEIPLSNEKKEWFSYVDSTVTAELLKQLTEEFLVIFEMCPSRLKEKIMAIGEGANMCRGSSQIVSPFESEPRKLHPPTDLKDPHHRLHHHEKQGLEEKHRSRLPHEATSTTTLAQREREYREKKERERLAQHSRVKPTVPHPTSSKQSGVPHAHHRPPTDPKLKQPHSRPPPMGAPNRTDHRDVFKETARDAGVRDSHAKDSARPSSELMDSVKETPSKDLVRGDKRDYNAKLNLTEQPDNATFVADKRLDSRSRTSLPEPKAMPHKHELGRHEQKPQFVKQEVDTRKHMNANWYDTKNLYDKNNVHMKPPLSQKVKSPFSLDSSKSVPKSNVKIESHNGSSNGGYGLPLVDDVVKQEVKEENYYQLPVKKPSMFSPEKSPPRKQLSSSSKRPDGTGVPTPISPLEPFGGTQRRSRTASNSSEPELRPVMKKIDQVEGFENILRDSTIGIKQEAPDVLGDVQSISATMQLGKESKRPDVVPSCVPLSQPIVNGIETNPTLISNLLKEAPSVPHLPSIAKAVAQLEEVPIAVTENKEKEHHHKDRKKKSKEKHKHKDREKTAEEKEKKKKSKDKEKDKHKSKNRDKDKSQELTQPIKITISKDKIQPVDVQQPAHTGLKIKIPKDLIKTDVIGNSSSNQQPCIKIKISKDVITNMGNDSGSRKRDRDRGPSSTDPSSAKVPKTSYGKQHADKQNGRSSYAKVAQMGDGDTSVHRLAESKYINKGAST